MELWLIFALAATLSWGLWGFFSKLAVERIEPRSAIIYEIIGKAAVGLIVLNIIAFPVVLTALPTFTGIVAGALILIGGLMFLNALNKGKASLVVPLTALYPVITIFLGYLVLSEGISLTQGVGMVLAVVAAYLIKSRGEDR